MIVLIIAPAHAKKLDATVSFIIHNPEKNDVQNIIKEFSKNFSNVIAFDITKNTNYYLYYKLNDANIDTRLISSNISDVSSQGEDFKTSSQYSKYLNSENKIKVEAASKRPFSGEMTLYSAFGTQLIKARSRDQYKSARGALKGAISAMRRAINDQSDKMSIRQRSRCLFCGFNELKENQKIRAANLAFIAEGPLLKQLYQKIQVEEVGINLAPYANLYFELGELDSLEHILDTGAVAFTNDSPVKKLPGHLLNQALKQQLPKDIIQKISSLYQANNFDQLDSNNLTPLWSAIAENNLPLMQSLINLGVNVNLISDINNSALTPLALSIQYGSLETTNLLLKNGARTSSQPDSIFPWSAAMWLAKYDQADLVWPSLPQDKSADEAQNLLIQATYYGQKDKFEQMHALGVPISASGYSGDNIAVAAVKGLKTFSIPSNELNAPIHSIDKSVYWQIIDHAAEANGVSQSEFVTSNKNILHHAYPEPSQTFTDSHLQLVKKLIAIGANQSNIDKSGKTADEAYQAARLEHIDQQHKARITQINLDRLNSAIYSQEQQDKIDETAKNAAVANQQYEEQQKLMGFAKNSRALNDVTRRTSVADPRGRIVIPEFNKSPAEIEKSLNGYKRTLDAANKAARDAYIIDAKQAAEIAEQKIKDENNRYEQQKILEATNTTKRQKALFKLLASNS